jgi:hypothetical protein
MASTRQVQRHRGAWISIPTIFLKTILAPPVVCIRRFLVLKLAWSSVVEYNRNAQVAFQLVFFGLDGELLLLLPRIKGCSGGWKDLDGLSPSEHKVAPLEATKTILI